VSILNFGCRVNQAESIAIERDVCAAGGEMVAADSADLVIVNSCSVTATADQGTRQSIRRVARENPSAKIVVTGCYATRAPGDVRGLPGVIHVVPNERKEDAATEAMAAASVGAVAWRLKAGGRELGTPEQNPGTLGTPERNLEPGTRNPEPVPIKFYANRTAFTLRVQTGCQETCSYCVIPSTRGAERSTPVSQLVDAVRQLEGVGYREVTLTGVHLGSYGRDLEPRASLEMLIDALLCSTDVVRFRLGSLEPIDCTPALIERASTTSRLAPAFHLPLQHASDRVLSAMRRPYTCADYERVVRAIRSRLPHASITADVIVGFPGETAEDFDALLHYLASSPLTQLHVFPYSDRPGTLASGMNEKLHGSIVRERARAVRELGTQLARRFRRSQAGTLRPALTIEDGSVALTDNGFRVRMPPGHRRNECVMAEIPQEEGGPASLQG